MTDANLYDFPLNSGDALHCTKHICKLNSKIVLINATISSILPMTNKYPSDVEKFI